jgi:hypothetical protein
VFYRGLFFFLLLLLPFHFVELSPAAGRCKASTLVVGQSSSLCCAVGYLLNIIRLAFLLMSLDAERHHQAVEMPQWRAWRWLRYSLSCEKRELHSSTERQDRGEWVKLIIDISTSGNNWQLYIIINRGAVDAPASLLRHCWEVNKCATMHTLAVHILRAYVYGEKPEIGGKCVIKSNRVKNSFKSLLCGGERDERMEI